MTPYFSAGFVAATAIVTSCVVGFVGIGAFYWGRMTFTDSSYPAETNLQVQAYHEKWAQRFRVAWRIVLPLGFLAIVAAVLVAALF